MKPSTSVDPIQVEREKLLYVYSRALENGNFETVAAVLAQAGEDATLEHMLLEIHEVYISEEQQAQEHASQNLAVLLKAKSRTNYLRSIMDRFRNFHLGSWTGWRAWSAVGAVAVLALVMFVYAYGSRVHALPAMSSPGYASDNSRNRASVTTNGPAPAPADVDLAYGRAKSDEGATVGNGDYYSGEADGGVTSPGQPAPDQAAALDRLIIRTGSINLLVQDTRAVRLSIEQMVAEMAAEGAFVVSASEGGGGEKVAPYIYMSIRIPAERFDDVMDRLGTLAVRVIDSSENAQDVTEEYVDIRARLDAMILARDRLIEIMNEADTTEDLLKAEEQLTQREAQIESLQGRMQYLEASARLSSLTITLTPDIVSQPVENTWRPAETVRRAYDDLVKGFQSFINWIIYTSITTLVWLAPLAVVVIIVVRVMIVRRRRNMKRDA